MTSNLRRLLVAVSFVLSSGSASALKLELIPVPQKLHPPENLFVDVRVSGLHSDGVDSFLGAFEFDLAFIPNSTDALRWLPASTINGNRLGSIAAGEAIWEAQSDRPGVMHFLGVSLLDEMLLAEAQSAADGSPLDDIVLMRLAFFAPADPISDAFFFSTGNILLVDGAGNQIADVAGNTVSVTNPSLRVPVPAPSGVSLLVVMGLAGLAVRFGQKRRWCLLAKTAVMGSRGLQNAGA